MKKRRQISRGLRRWVRSAHVCPNLNCLRISHKSDDKIQHAHDCPRKMKGVL